MNKNKLVWVSRHPLTDSQMEMISTRFGGEEFEVEHLELRTMKEIRHHFLVAAYAATKEGDHVRFAGVLPAHMLMQVQNLHPFMCFENKLEARAGGGFDPKVLWTFFEGRCHPVAFGEGVDANQVLRENNLSW